MTHCMLCIEEGFLFRSSSMFYEKIGRRPSLVAEKQDLKMGFSGRLYRDGITMKCAAKGLPAM